MNKEQFSFNFPPEDLSKKKIGEEELVETIKKELHAVEVPYSDEQWEKDKKEEGERKKFNEKTDSYMNTYPSIRKDKKEKEL